MLLLLPAAADVPIPGLNVFLWGIEYMGIELIIGHSICWWADAEDDEDWARTSGRFGLGTGGNWRPIAYGVIHFRGRGWG